MRAVAIREEAYRAGLLARVYEPVGAAPLAAVLDVHGGDWIGGDRFQQEILDRSLAANGVLIAAIDYRLAPAHPYPAAVEDVRAALDWLAERTSGMPLGALGSSAGGHLVLLSALRRDIAFVIADAPVSDPVEYLQTYGGPHPFWPHPKLASEGSPLSIVARGMAQALPPLLITHGDRDDAVPLEMSERFVAAYRSAGGHAELEVFHGLGHAFVLSQPRRRESSLLAERMLSFIRAHARST
jgi:acetyl esterase/lipase